MYVYRIDSERLFLFPNMIFSPDFVKFLGNNAMFVDVTYMQKRRQDFHEYRIEATRFHICDTSIPWTINFQRGRLNQS